MTDTTDPKPENDLDIDFPPGFTDLSGPAAFKARQDAEDVSSPDQAGSDNAPADMGPALIEKVKTLEQALMQSNDQLLRSVAEMENFRKRSQREREDAGKFAISSFAKAMIDVADNFRRALDAIPDDLRGDAKIKPLVDGIEATERTMLKAFELNGIKKLEPLDEAFNPNFHEVMFESPAPGKPAGTIIQLIEAGYTLNDRLLRPARVGVAKGGPGAEPLHHVDTEA